jgi:hypothetical protein
LPISEEQDMKMIETVVTISQTGEVQLARQENLPAGRFKVVLVIDESPLAPPEISEPNWSENSFLAAAGELIGCLEDLPPDLSHNKQYLEGLGESCWQGI